jgi:hypothetical protein
VPVRSREVEISGIATMAFAERKKKKYMPALWKRNLCHQKSGASATPLGTTCNLSGISTIEIICIQSRRNHPSQLVAYCLLTSLVVFPQGQ